MSIERLDTVEDLRVAASITAYNACRTELKRAGVLNSLTDYLIFDRPPCALTLAELTFAMHGHRLQDWGDEAFPARLGSHFLYLENTFRGAPDMMMAQYANNNPYAPIALGLVVVRPRGSSSEDQHNEGIRLSLTSDNRRKYTSRLTVPLIVLREIQGIATPVLNDLILVESNRSCYKSGADGMLYSVRQAFGTPAIVSRLDGLEDEAWKSCCLTAVGETEALLRAAAEDTP